MYAPSGVRFAAHVALYAPCYYRYRDDDRLTGSPIRLFHGDADDITPVDPCLEFVGRLKNAGADAEITTFAGARHGYDTAATQPVAIAMAQNLGACRVEERDGGKLVNVSTGRDLTVSDACVRQLNTVIVADDAATASTIVAVRAFLQATLRSGASR